MKLESKRISLTITFDYKWNPDGKLQKRKVLNSLRLDTMQPGIQFNSEHRSAPMQQKATVIPIIALSVDKQLIMGHLDGKAVFTDA